MKIKLFSLKLFNYGKDKILMYFKGKSSDTTENIDVHLLKSAVVSVIVIVI